MSDTSLARAPHRPDPARRLRSGAWLLQRSWRHPHRLPAGWRSERFAFSVDRVRRQLGPIHTLSALTDSFARESGYLADLVAADSDDSAGSAGRADPAGSVDAPRDTALELAYLTRWIELDGGRDLLGWRSLCARSER